MDETCFSTVQDGQIKINSEKGKKIIEFNTSQERGISTTGVICCSPTGHYILPMVIYKRKRIP